MEFVGANSLRDFIAGCPFSEGETRALMRRLLAGVRAMHRAGMAHRDIKPGNILVGPGFALKICDFGMATTAPPPYEPYMELAGVRRPAVAVAGGARGARWAAGLRRRQEDDGRGGAGAPVVHGGGRLPCRPQLSRRHSFM
ncbi:hypothetical protein EE612_050131, partial [Oryza sativa]